MPSPEDRETCPCDRGFPELCPVHRSPTKEERREMERMERLLRDQLDGYRVKVLTELPGDRER